VLSVSHELAAATAANTQGWLQAGELGLGLLLSAVIGLEREIRQKSAGLRTHALVGVGAALFMLISKYGFSDVLQPGRVVLDPSRVAAQIVTGIGFLGAGLIFVRRDSVRGLTTAASVWLTAAVGAAAGAGLPLLAAAATGGYLVAALAFPQLTRRLPRSGTAISLLRVSYPDSRGILRQILQLATERGFAVDQLATDNIGRARTSGRNRAVADRAQRVASDGTQQVASDGQPMVEVTLHVHGRYSVNDLAAQLSELPGVHAVTSDDVNIAAD
jgi:putative Mg2+ transporter-C (MgtC) family protein